MLSHHYGTDLQPRTEVAPGTFIKHHGRIWRASANVSKGLYIFSLFERTIIKSDEVEVYLNSEGNPLIH